VKEEKDKPAKRQIRRRHFKADSLPKKLKDELCRKFQAGVPYLELEAWLREEGHPIGHSSVQRWGAPFQAVLEKVALCREGAQTIVGLMAGKPATELNEATEQIAVQMLMEVLVSISQSADAEVAGEPKDLSKRAGMLAKISSALSGLGHSASYRERTKVVFQERIAPARKAAADAAKKALEKSGATKESVTQVVDKILGIGA